LNGLIIKEWVPDDMVESTENDRDNPPSSEACSASTLPQPDQIMQWEAMIVKMEIPTIGWA
jgi:hypothetical protein